MKLKYTFVINDVAGTTVAVPVGEGSDQFHGYIKLNVTGAYIFKMLKNDVTREEIIAAVLKDFTDCTEAEVAATVDGFISRLEEAEVLC